MSANLGLTPSSLPPLMEKYLAHFSASPHREKGIIHFGGGNPFVSHYTTFDTTQRRGVVVLSSSGNGRYKPRSVGKFLLESWNGNRTVGQRRPT